MKIENNISKKRIQKKDAKKGRWGVGFKYLHSVWFLFACSISKRRKMHVQFQNSFLSKLEFVVKIDDSSELQNNKFKILVFNKINMHILY